MYMRRRKRTRRGRREVVPLVVGTPEVGPLVVGTPEPSVEPVERTKDTVTTLTCTHSCTTNNKS